MLKQIYRYNSKRSRMKKRDDKEMVLLKMIDEGLSQMTLAKTKTSQTQLKCTAGKVGK